MWWAYRGRHLGEYHLHTGLAGSCCRMGTPHLPFSLAPGSHGRKRASGNWRSHLPPTASWFCGPGQTLPRPGAQLPQITRKGGFDSDLGQPKTPKWRRAPSLNSVQSLPPSPTSFYPKGATGSFYTTEKFILIFHL